MKDYVYIGCCRTKRGLTPVSVQIVKRESDIDALGGVLTYLEFDSADIESVLVFDATANEQICEVQL